MGGLASVLPFLASIRKQIPDLSGGDPGTDPNAGMNLGADWGNAPPAPAPTPPPGPIAQQPVSQLPNMGTGEPPAAPEDKGNLFRQPYETKGHALMRILQGGVVGGLSGLSANAATYGATGRNAGFGGGVAAGYTQALPMQAAFQKLGLQKAGLENEQLIQMLPFLRAQNIAGLTKITAEANKAQAEAGKATAETGAVATKSALEQAQANAAKYQHVGDSLYDISGSTPQMVAGAKAILDEPTARVLGKQPGDVVPLDVATKGKNLVDQGLSYQQANGHNWLVDKQGNKLKDMGVATPVTVFNMQNAGATGTPGQPSAIAKALADGSMKWSDAVSPRTPMNVKSALLNEVKSINPNFNSGDFDVEKQAKITATSGTVGQQLLAIGTARQHMKTFLQLANALDNNDIQLANKIGNAFSVQFGEDKVNNLRIAAQAFGGEVGKAFDGAGVVAKEREDAQSKMADYLSKGQFRGAVQTADELLAGKQRAAHSWFDQAVQGKPDFGQTQNEGVNAGGIKVGDKVKLKNGQTITVKEVHADGSFD